MTTHSANCDLYEKTGDQCTCGANWFDLGRVTWLSSDEDSGPDIGIVIGLGKDQAVQFGEITRDRWEEGGVETAALGDDSGWWLTLCHPSAGFQPIAKFVDPESAREFCDMIEELVHRAAKVPDPRDALLAKMAEALRFYADDYNHHETIHERSPVFHDDGKIASDALAEYEAWSGAKGETPNAQ